MRKLLPFLLLLAAWPVAAQQLTFPATSTDNVFTGKNTFQGNTFTHLTQYTVATLPAAGTLPQYIVTVTDGVTTADCTSGGGSTYALCQSNGTGWVSLGGSGGGGGGTPSAPFTSLQFNNSGAFGGSANLQYASGTSTLTLLSNGVFTNTQMNEFLQSLINSISLATEYAALNSGFSTDGIAGGVLVSGGSTVNTANGLAGYVQNNSTSTGASGLYGQARCLTNNTKCWGGHVIVSDSAAITGTTLQAFEADTNVNNTSHASGYPVGITVGGFWSAQAADGAAFRVIEPNSASPGTYFWQKGIELMPEATNGSGIVLHSVSASASGNHNSQSIVFGGTATGVESTASIFGDPTGNIELIPASAKTVIIGASGTITFNGSSSGSAGIGVAAAAGTPCTILLPTTNPTSGYALASGAPAGGLCQTSWVPVSTGTIGGSITAAQVPFGSGTNTITGSSQLLFSTTTGMIQRGNGSNSSPGYQMCLISSSCFTPDGSFTEDASGNMILAAIGGKLELISTNAAGVTVGNNAGATPILTFNGSSTGSAALGAAASAGTPNRMNLPISTGTSGYFLTTDGGSPQQLSWAAPPGGSWSSLTNPAGNLALSMGSNTSIFSTTTALAQMFAWKNTTAAVVGTSQGSPVPAICGTAFHASASVEDCLTLSDLPGNGNDAAITFTVGHTGFSTGLVTTQFPGPMASGAQSGVNGTLTLPGSSSGTVTITTQNAAGTPTVTWGTSTGTPAVTASSPLGITTATGNITCATCGVTGTGLNQFASTTSAQLAGVLSDETGTGVAVFSTSPTLVTPALGAATATSIATGTSPPTCTIGTAGAICQNEGTAPTGASSVGEIWANATAHCEDVNSNNVELGCVVAEPAGLVTVQTITGADYTNTSVTPSTVFSWTLPTTAAAKNYRYTCDIMWESTGVTLVGPVFGLNMSAAPTQLTGAAAVQNALTGVDVNGYLSNTTTGSQTLVTSSAAGVTSTNYWAKIWGTIEASPTAGATFIINAASTSGTTATLNIRRGSACKLEVVQ